MEPDEFAGKSFLLWFDDDPRRTTEEKMRRGAAFFKRKHGYAPKAMRLNKLKHFFDIGPIEEETNEHAVTKLLSR